MQMARSILVCSAMLCVALPCSAGTENGTVTGIVTFRGTLPKKVPLDLAKELACSKMHATDPLYDEAIVTGRGNGLANVVVYISGDTPDPGPASSKPVVFDQLGCRYRTHVLAVQVGQEIQITNSDHISHNIHPLAKINREWARMQPPGTPPFSYSYEKEEFIPVKCNLHPWMQGYIVVLKTSHFTVTLDNGVFRLPDLPPGRYTVTAWHELLGTQSQEIVVTGGETNSVYFVFSAKP